jgi:putative two-component system response regulator
MKTASLSQVMVTDETRSAAGPAATLPAETMCWPDRLRVTEGALWNDLEEAARPATILILDSTEVNRRLIRGMLRGGRHRILEAKRPSEALEKLVTEPVDLIIIDLMMPEMSGPEFCRRLKSGRQTHLIPILMLTSIQGAESEIMGISSGADEFLVKPLHAEVVRTRVRAMLRNKALIDSLDEAEAIIFSLARAVEQRDEHTGQHCERLALWSVAIGRTLGLPAADLRCLHRGGFLHDIGKIAVPDAILFKPGRLTEEEWVVMRQHTVAGENICRPMKSLAGVLPIIRHHHERWDGSGYPDGLAGEEIPLLARILQLADIYDALTSARPYKRAFTHDEAIATLQEETARGWRDARLVEVLHDVCQACPEIDGVRTPLSLLNLNTELAK